MKNKKLKVGLTLKSIPIEEADELRQELYPNIAITTEWTMISAWHGDELYSYLLYEYQTETQVSLHISIPKERRTTKCIQRMVDALEFNLIPELKKQGIKQLLTSCAYDDIKTKTLADTFGFHMEAHWLGGRNI